MKTLLLALILFAVSCGGNQSPPPIYKPPVDTGGGTPLPVDTPIYVPPVDTSIYVQWNYSMTYWPEDPLVLEPFYEPNQINDISTQVFEDSVSTRIEILFKGMKYRIIASDTANVLYIYGISGDLILKCDSIRLMVTTKADSTY